MKLFLCNGTIYKDSQMSNYDFIYQSPNIYWWLVWEKKYTRCWECKVKWNRIPDLEVPTPTVKEWHMHVDYI